MTDIDDVPSAVAGAFERHDAFERDGDGFALETTAFDVTATATDAGSDESAGTFTVRTAVPALSATVADADDVAPVVEDGWLETFERRLEDAFDVTKAAEDGTTRAVREGDRVHVDLEYEAASAHAGVSDAKALAEYVEGTFVQGLVPGYDYVGVAAELRSAASQNAGADGDGDRSGTPL